jgi:hypothetical protein
VVAVAFLAVLAVLVVMEISPFRVAQYLVQFTPTPVFSLLLIHVSNSIKWGDMRNSGLLLVCLPYFSPQLKDDFI